DICPARLFFLTGINVFLPSKAEIPPGTRHDCGRYFLNGRCPGERKPARVARHGGAARRSPRARERPRNQATQQGRFRKFWNRLASIRRGVCLSTPPHQSRSYLPTATKTLVFSVSFSNTSAEIKRPLEVSVANSTRISIRLLSRIMSSALRSKAIIFPGST